MSYSSAHITTWLKSWNDGDEHALEELAPLVFDDLRRMASRQLARESAGHVLQSTALVNEVFLKLLDRKALQWQNSAQFFAVVAEQMRRILVDHARRRKADKRHGDLHASSLDEALNVAKARDLDLVALDDALDDLAEIDGEASEIIKLRFFVGLSYAEISQALGISKMAARRQWTRGKVWLYRHLAATRDADTSILEKQGVSKEMEAAGKGEMSPTKDINRSSKETRHVERRKRPGEYRRIEGTDQAS
ncbi:MAG: sigma-70 family RNA polymerase sigma factor [bacterium]|nr:sigma-70 family RNA polymerase sigma factor [bacterium]